MPGLRAAVVAVACAALLVAVPAGAGVTLTTTGTVNAAGTKWNFKVITVSTNGTLSATLTWSTTSAKLLLGLAHKNGTSWKWITGRQGAQPLTLTYPVTAGTWRLAVEALSGRSSYTLTATYPTGTPPPGSPSTFRPCSNAGNSSMRRCANPSA